MQDPKLKFIETFQEGCEEKLFSVLELLIGMKL